MTTRQGSAAWWVRAVQTGSRVASTALVYGFGDLGERLLAVMAVDLRAYCDESYTQDCDFVVAGYVAPAAEWLKLEGPWQEALRETGLSEFKMRNCEMGQGEFKDRTDRPDLQRRFIALIKSIDVLGYAVRIDLRTYKEVRKQLEPEVHPKYFAAWLQAFSTQVSFLATFARPYEEPIAFVFDEQHEYARRAHDLYNQLKQGEVFQGYARLGAITFDDSKRLVPLQAADMLAYEVHRRFRSGEQTEPLRWQSVEIGNGGKTSVALLGEKEIRAWATMSQEQPPHGPHFIPEESP
jgi:Protein of unknown function (DUF3800)